MTASHMSKSLAEDQFSTSRFQTYVQTLCETCGWQEAADRFTGVLLPIGIVITSAVSMLIVGAPAIRIGIDMIHGYQLAGRPPGTRGQDGSAGGMST